MKKKIFIFLVLYFAIGRLFSMDFSLLGLTSFSVESEKNKETKSFSVEITPSFGVMFGRASEYVYLDYEEYAGIKDYNPKLSQLDYDFTFPYFSLAVDSILFKFLYLGGSFSIGIPLECGIMQDYDWLNVENPSHQWANELTNYSKHENYLDSYFDCKLNIGPNINILNKVSLIPLVGFGLDSIQFSAYNGSFKYGNKTIGGYTPIHIDSQEFNYTGKDIIYSQYSSDGKGTSSIHFNIGLKYLIKFIPRVLINGSCLFYPFYSVSSYDYHIRTGREYISVVAKSFKFSTDLKISFIFNKFLSAGIFGQFEIIPQYKGVTYSRLHNSGNYIYSNNCQSGIDRISGKVSLVFGLSF